MESSIPASEIKRRGISVVDEALKRGPVHVVKHNRPQYVILSEEAYAKLTRGDRAAADLWAWLEQGTAFGRRSKADIDAALKEERDAWDDR